MGNTNNEQIISMITNPSVLNTVKKAHKQLYSKNSDAFIVYPKIILSAEITMKMAIEAKDKMLREMQASLLELKVPVHDLILQDHVDHVQILVALVHKRNFKKIAADLYESCSKIGSFTLPPAFMNPIAVSYLKKMKPVKALEYLRRKRISFNYYSGGVPDSPTAVSFS